jgi:hypothetical protein
MLARMMDDISVFVDGMMSHYSAVDELYFVEYIEALRQTPRMYNVHPGERSFDPLTPTSWRRARYVIS